MAAILEVVHACDRCGRVRADIAVKLVSDVLITRRRRLCVSCVRAVARDPLVIVEDDLEDGE